MLKEKPERYTQEENKMTVISELLRVESDNTLSFGDYSLADKTKLDNFEFQGDLYKVKTFKAITKLEKNGMFAYESVPGTAVEKFRATENGVDFTLYGADTSAQFTVGLAEESMYEVYVNGESVGTMAANLSGKLSVSVELHNDEGVEVKIEKR